MKKNLLISACIALLACSPKVDAVTANSAEQIQIAAEYTACRDAAKASDGGFASYDVCAKLVDAKHGVKP